MKRIIIILLTSVSVRAQQTDHVITLAGDTVSCRLMPDPLREGIRIKRKEGLNGFGYVVAEFGSDSVRILKPEEIKGFFKKEHHRRLPQGNYITVQEKIPSRPLLGRDHNEPEPLFLRVLVDGPLYRLLHHSYWDGEDALPYYWIEHVQTGERRYLRGPAGLKQWLEACNAQKDLPKLPRGQRNNFYRLQQLARLANDCRLPWPPPENQ